MIVDDHPIIRHGMRRIIENDKNFIICCEAENKSQAYKSILECMPDLIIVDISLIDGNGIELIIIRIPIIKRESKCG